MNYLMIQNPGVAPIEAFTLLGMSMSDGGGDSRLLIGKFGSGNKLAINLLLRLGRSFRIYCGKTRLEFYTESETISDGLTSKEVKHVVCKLSGTSSRTIRCGWTLDWGQNDWKTVDMALREFVSNSIDRTVRQEGGFRQSIRDNELNVVPVMETQVRAADGYTRVFVEIDDKVQKYYAELPRRFLHFSNNPNQVYESILPKAERNLSGHREAMIYRCGVFVREMRGRESLYDYNFAKDEMEIDECRNSSGYALRAACAKLMGKKVDSDTLATVVKSMIEGRQTFESDLDADYVTPTWDVPSDEQKAVWGEAWNKANDNGPAILCLEGNIVDTKIIKEKGYTPRKVSSQTWVNLFKRMGVKHSSDVLTDNEARGRQELPPTDAALKAVNKVWEWVDALGLTQGKDVPKAMGFRDIGDDTATLGYWESGTNEVFLRENISAATEGIILGVAMEMVACYITGSTERTNDYNKLLVDMIVGLAI